MNRTPGGKHDVAGHDVTVGGYGARNQRVGAPIVAGKLGECLLGDGVPTECIISGRRLSGQWQTGGKKNA
jgi:hypothetical protein